MAQHEAAYGAVYAGQLRGLGTQPPDTTAVGPVRLLWLRVWVGGPHLALAWAHWNRRLSRMVLNGLLRLGRDA